MTQKGHSGFFEQQSKPSTQGAFCDEIKKEVYNIYYYGPKSTKAAGLEGGGEKERNQILQFIYKDKERHKSNSFCCFTFIRWKEQMKKKTRGKERAWKLQRLELEVLDEICEDTALIQPIMRGPGFTQGQAGHTYAVFPHPSILPFFSLKTAVLDKRFREWRECHTNILSGFWVMPCGWLCKFHLLKHYFILVHMPQKAFYVCFAVFRATCRCTNFISFICSTYTVGPNVVISLHMKNELHFISVSSTSDKMRDCYWYINYTKFVQTLIYVLL